MIHRPPLASGARAAAGGLTLVVHGLLVTVLLVEDRELLHPLPASRVLLGMWIHLPVLPVPAAADASPPPAARATSGSRGSPGLSGGITLPPPPAGESPDLSGDDSPVPPVDWALAAERRASTYGDDPVTFGPPLETMRRPCKPRVLDKATAALMDERLPPPRDRPLDAGSGQKNVYVGGVRVGIVPIFGAGTKRRSEDNESKSSFRWKWDYSSSGGIAALTPGWEKPPKYDGMFDDMQAGKTPDSSVPDPDHCD